MGKLYLARAFLLACSFAFGANTWAVDASYAEASKAEISKVAGQTVYTFTNTTEQGALKLNRAARVRYLIVGGGGAGATAGSANATQGAPGGGGAGGLIEATDVLWLSGDYAITVGAGGVVGDATTQAQGQSGQESSIAGGELLVENLTALGGGGGGILFEGQSGGSGGGGSAVSRYELRDGGLGRLGQGRRGGAGSKLRAGGGGGGAGGPGGDVTADGAPGAGGAGLTSDITGKAVLYAAGGAGGKYTLDADAVKGQDGAGYGFGGGGSGRKQLAGKGGDGIVVIRILDWMPEKPTDQTVSYTGEEQVIVPPSAAYTIEPTEAKVKDVGTYTFTISLNDGFVWSDGTTESSVSIQVVVKPAVLTITDFAIVGWRAGMEPQKPTFTANLTLTEGVDYVIEYSADEGKTWTTTTPTNAGTYQVRMCILNPSGNYTYTGGDLTATFTVDPAVACDMPELGYSATFTVTDSMTAGWKTVTLRANQPENFAYHQAWQNGQDVRFISVTADGTIQTNAFTILSWDTNGESKIAVKLPRLVADETVMMFWGKLTGQNLPSPVTASDEPLTPPADGSWTMSPTSVRAHATFENWWMTPPSIEFTTWQEGGTPPTVTPGVAAYGTAYYQFDDGLTSPVPNTIPTAAGSYEFRVVAEGGSIGTTSQWSPLVWGPQQVLITPAESAATDALGGTATGRLLLANNYDDGTQKVTDQAYDNINTAAAVYWHHSTEATVFALPNLHVGATHQLWHRADATASSTWLWWLDHVRLGNLYTSEDLKKSTSRNYLPAVGLTPAEITHCALQNTTDAAIYSCTYTEGIGTVYFDAVNVGLSDDGVGYSLVLEVSTNVVSDASAPTVDGDEWTPVEMHPLKTTNGTPFEVLAPTNQLALAINANGVDGGSDRNFYRVYAKIDTTDPIRFRLRRTSIVEASSANPDASAAFILVDNIAVSYPSMRADLAPYGFLDDAKTGAQTLGQELAWGSVAFPSVADQMAVRAKVTYTTNASLPTADTASFITSAKMFYRWRYLDQIVPNEWEFIGLDPITLTSDRMLDLTQYGQGDIEFWYELVLNAPYYEYYDYSGANLQLGGLYTEQVSVLTNALAATTPLESRGTDWFVRLREGKSVYEQVNLAVIAPTSDGVTTNRYPLAVVADQLWRGYLPTPSNATDVVQYRLELLNKQVNGDTEFAFTTNYWAGVTDKTDLPINTTAQAVGETTWQPLQLDNKTGGFLFQLNEADESKLLTILHADYQDFNKWSDAAGATFLSSAKLDAGKVGTSSAKRTYESTIPQYTYLENTKPDWTLPNETWTNIDGLGDRKTYEFFESATWDSAWHVYNGMWVAQCYRAPNTGVGVQLKGEGLGYAQITKSAYVPKGIDTISFNARLAQAIEFRDFTYADDVGDKGLLTNYTFVALGAFDLNRSENFGGNASLSLVAYYTAEGCYELRVEQFGAEMSGDRVTAPNPNDVRLSLYRWKHNQATGVMDVTQLGSTVHPASFVMPRTAGENGLYVPLYISVSNDVNDAVCITAGVRNTGAAKGALEPFLSGSFGGVMFKDSSDHRLTCGTYGVVSANCDGVFVNPYKLPKPLNVAGETYANNALKVFQNKAVGDMRFATEGAESCYQLLDPTREGWWAPAGRMEKFRESERNFGLRAKPLSQTLYLDTASPDASEESDWSYTGYSFTVDTFGRVGGGTHFTRTLEIPQTCSLRLRVGGANESRRDVVIDSFRMTSWAGRDWNEDEVLDCIIPSDEMYAYNEYAYRLTNFVFRTCLPRTGGLLMSTRRAPDLETPVAIYSPLMDGSSGRGVGLGMISFDYENRGETPAKLLLQIATNQVSDTSWATLQAGDFNSAGWVSVPEAEFNLPAGQSGKCNFYLGLHGIAGGMRLVMDPNVKAEITITDIVCRDEPNLDSYSWWGWNLRMAGDFTGATALEQNRMFLPDRVRRGATGLSLALNNSVTADIDTSDAETYKEHMPFVQTPTFGTNIVGSVSFKARTYEGAADTTAYVSVYGCHSGLVEDDAQWERLADIPITSQTYANYTYTVPAGRESFKAFRLMVTGVPGVTAPETTAKDDNDYNLPSGATPPPVRVLIDEVLVSEALRARLGFTHVGAFRNYLSETTAVPNIPSAEEQPLVGEGWGVQCELLPTQLEGEIDWAKTPQVFLHWHMSPLPWGYSNWKHLANTAELAPATDQPRVYRSSYLNAPAAVVSPVQSARKVQYMLEVVYYEKGSDIPITNRLESADWTTPSWYAPVELNGPDKDFAAYTILDTVAPGWAWINEVNIFGKLNGFINTEGDCQFVEVAAPQAADLTGWKLRMLAPLLASDKVITNDVATFGGTYGNLPGTKTKNADAASKMVFHVVGNNYKNRLTADEIDGTWGFATTGSAPVFDFYSTTSYGQLDDRYPFAIQLIRPSGIVEHQLVCIGNDEYAADDQELYDPQTAAEFLANKFPGRDFISMGADSQGYEDPANETGDYSLSVITNTGASVACWTNRVVRTPGRINNGQVIDGQVPTANGELVTVYAEVDAASQGLVLQKDPATGEWTPDPLVLFVRRGGDGTNLVYQTARWHQLDSVSVTTNGVTRLAPVEGPSGLREYIAEDIGKGATDNVTAVAKAKRNSEFATQVTGLDENPEYENAVLDWLMKGQTLKGDFANPETEELKPAYYEPLPSGTRVQLSLLDMYWLDMDPTVGNLALRGRTDLPDPKTIERPTFDGGTSTNAFLDVTLYMTNEVSHAAWTPYVLRGVTPGEHSMDFVKDTTETPWTSVTFKVAGLLPGFENAKSRLVQSPSTRMHQVDLRWFVFTPNSFTKLDGSDSTSGLPPGTARIEITDPYSSASPGYAVWREWLEQQTNPPAVLLKWAIDTRSAPISIEELKKENLYGPMS